MTATNPPAATAPPLPRRRSVTRHTMLFLVLVCLALLTVEGWSSYSSRKTALDQATTSNVNMARALSDHAEASIDLADSILSGLVEQYRDGELAEAPERLHTHLARMVSQTKSLQGLFLFGADGASLLNSLADAPAHLNYADREYFVYHRTHRDLSAHVGDPVVSRTSGAWVLPISRRLEHADGSFAGVALATLRIDFFRSFYDSFGIGQQGAIFLATDSGRYVVRRPYNERLIGADISGGPVYALWKAMGETGSATLVARVDQVERLYTYRHLRNYPLLIAVALSKEEVLARWRSSTIVGGVATVLLFGALLLLGTRILRQMIERDKLQAELRDAKTALEANNAALQLLALSDGLTGLANRRHFDQRLKAEFKRAMRDQTPLALIMFDVDYFKKFNDNHGHVEGDGALQMVGAVVLAGQRRPGDTAARFGGEEFAMLLPDTGLDGALAVAQAVRAAIAARKLPHGASPFRILTVSAGVHAFIPQPGQLARTLVEAADRGLYQAKAEGRNSVCAEPEETEETEQQGRPGRQDAV